MPKGIHGCNESTRIKHIDHKGSALLRCAPTLELQRKRKLRESKDVLAHLADLKHKSPLIITATDDTDCTEETP